MKGLLVKDYRFLLGQKSSFLIFVVLGLFFLLTGEDISFGISYSMIFATIFATSSITYDSNENGMAYLLTLPVQRKAYVVEKYIFSIIMVVFMAMIMCALMLGGSVFTETKFDIRLVADSFVVAFTMAVLMMAVMIPVYVIFGAEKARVAIMVIAGVVLLGVCLLSEYGGDVLMKLDQILGKVGDLSRLTMSFLLIGVFIVILGISMLITIKGLERKEY